MERIAAQRRLYTGLIVVLSSPLVGLLGYYSFLVTGSSTSEIEAQWTILGVLTRDLREFAANFPLDQVILAITAAFTFLPALVWWLSVSAVMHMITGRLGSAGDFRATLAVIGVACLPFTVLQVLVIASGLVSASLRSEFAWVLLAVQVLAWVWHVSLVVIGTHFARRIDYARSAGSCSISCFMLLGFFVVLVILLFGLIAILDRLIV